MGQRFVGQRLIGTLAAELGIKARTLRYYETIGLLPAPRRTTGGYRVYDGRTAQRIDFITRAKSLGLTLKEIGEILTVYDSGKAPCRTVQQLLREHLHHIEDQIRRLRALKVDLRAFLADWPVECETNGTAVCPRIEAQGQTDPRPMLKRGDACAEDRVPVPRLRSMSDHRGPRP